MCVQFVILSTVTQECDSKILKLFCLLESYFIRLEKTLDRHAVHACTFDYTQHMQNTKQTKLSLTN